MENFDEGHLLSFDELAILFFSNPDPAGIKTDLSHSVSAAKRNESTILTTKEGYFWAIFVVDLLIANEKTGAMAEFDIGDLSIERNISDFYNDSNGDYFEKLEMCFLSISQSLANSARPDLNEGLPGDTLKKKSEYIRSISYRSSMASSSLEKKGFIIDPVLEGLCFAVLGLVPYRFTMRSRDGQRVYTKFEAMFWRYECDKTISRLEKRAFEVKLFGAVSKFKKNFVRLISENYDPAQQIQREQGDGVSD